MEAVLSQDGVSENSAQNNNSDASALMLPL